MAYQRNFQNLCYGSSSAEIMSRLSSEFVTRIHAEVPLGTVRHIPFTEHVRSESQGVKIIGTHRVRARVKGFRC